MLRLLLRCVDSQYMKPDCSRNIVVQHWVDVVTSICLGEILVNDLFKTVNYDKCCQAKEFYHYHIDSS